MSLRLCKNDDVSTSSSILNYHCLLCSYSALLLTSKAAFLRIFNSHQISGVILTPCQLWEAVIKLA